MLPRKTGPAPIFNYRKRPRQAVVADPESQPPNTASKEPPGHKIPLPQPTSSYAASSSRPVVSFASRGGRGTSGVGIRPSAPLPAQNQRPHPPAPPAAAAAAATAGRPLPGQSGIQGNWRGGVDNRPGPRASAPNKDWRARSTSAPSPAGPSTPGGPGTSFKRQQPVYQPSPFMGVGGRGGGGGSNMSVPTVQHSPAVPSNKVTGGGDKRRTSTERSLHVLTLPAAHVKRAFGVLNDSMSSFLFCLFGMVDSATVSDMMSSGKSFSLRDESGRMTCIFCEIDRQMPRLHRGQWYRAVGVAKPSWQALQCLSLRPVSLEERQAARAVTSLSIEQLNDICLSVTEM